MSEREQLVRERFWSKVKKGNGCWEWQGTKSLGYGVAWLSKQKKIRAHRLSYTLNIGPIPNGLCVLHKCDNPACVKPNHLFLGTLADNVRDMVSKKRCAYGKKNGMVKYPDKRLYGTKNGQSKLTENDVKDILKKRISCNAYAKLYKVDQTNISQIWNRKIWAWVKI